MYPRRPFALLGRHEYIHLQPKKVAVHEVVSTFFPLCTFQDPHLLPGKQ